MTETMSQHEESGTSPLVPPDPLTRSQYRLKMVQSSLNLIAHILIGIVVGGSLMFAFRSGLPIGSTPIHIVLCVLGYKLLMAQAILSLCPHNGWSAHLNLGDKKRAHWILQILGSGLAVAGSFVKIIAKSQHWTSLHGQFALVALVFTTVSLVNGLTSLYAHEIRRYVPLPANLSKLTHICFGAIAFAAAGVALAFGMYKSSFKGFAGEGITYTLMVFTGLIVVIIIVNPVITFVAKIRGTLSNN